MRTLFAQCNANLRCLTSKISKLIVKLKVCFWCNFTSTIKTTKYKDQCLKRLRECSLSLLVAFVLFLFKTFSQTDFVLRNRIFLERCPIIINYSGQKSEKNRIVKVSQKDVCFFFSLRPLFIFSTHWATASTCCFVDAFH